MLGPLFLSLVPQPEPANQDVAAFLHARTHVQRSTAREAILAGKPSFDEVHAALKKGRNYAADVARGHQVHRRVDANGVVYPYVVLVPENYTPERAWVLRMYLHGGMGVKGWDPNDAKWTGGWTRANGQIMVFPAGWWDAMWWEHSQASNLEAILAQVKHDYNIHENRVYLQGNSDGGIGAFFYAFRQPDRWSAYVGHVGSPDRLVREQLRPDGQMHLCNLAGQRFHLGYGARDPKAPIKHLRRYLKLFEQHGAELDYFIKPNKGHNLHLTDAEEARMVQFVRHSVRDPLPDRLSWATERTDRYHRRSWVTIEEMDAAKPPSKDERKNLLPRWGSPIQLRGPTTKARPFARVDVERSGNDVTIQAQRVKRLRLLLSPSEFDFDRAVTVRLNGKVVHDGIVQRSVATLLKWAAVDDDRTMLFAAELVLPR